MRKAEADASGPATGRVPAVEKCLTIIRLLDGAGEAGLGLAAVAGQLGLTKSHCLQILRTLTAQGWAEHDAERQRYALAPALMLDLAVTLRRGDPESVVHDVMARLSQQLGLPCILTRVNRDGSFSCIDKVQQGAELMVSAPIGYRFPPDAPSQMRARLAALPVAEAERVLQAMTLRPHTATTVTDKAEVMRLVTEAKGLGYAIGRGEYLDGIMSIATAVTGAAATMILQCTGLTAMMASREVAIGAALRDAAARIPAAWSLPKWRDEHSERAPTP